MNRRTAMKMIKCYDTSMNMDCWIDPDNVTFAQDNWKGDMLLYLRDCEYTVTVSVEKFNEILMAKDGYQ